MDPTSAPGIGPVRGLELTMARVWGYFEGEYMVILDYRKYYFDEDYLLGEVSNNFKTSGLIEPADFLTILIWKANRAKGYHLKRLAARAGTFEKAVRTISLALRDASGSKERLQALMSESWGFYLATATAILTILYPDEFTVYDYRVAEELKFGQELATRDFSDELWNKYEQFCEKVKSFPPPELKLDLRGCDRYISGKSYRQDIENTIRKLDARV